MYATQARTRPTRQRNVVPLTVTTTDMRECGRIMTQYGAGAEWGHQPSEVAYLRENVARPEAALPRRVMLLLLFNNRAQQLADFIGARRRAKLGQSTAKAIPVLTLEETQINERTNVLQMKEETVGLDSAERAELVSLLRLQAEKSTLLADAEADKLFQDQAVRA